MEQINVKRWVFHLNILPPRSLLMLTSLMSFPKHQTALRNAPPSEETTRQRQPSHLSGTTRSLWGRKSRRNMFDWQSSKAQASIAPPHPPSPSSARGHWAVCRLDWTLWSLFTELWEQDLPTRPEYVRGWRREMCEDCVISTKPQLNCRKRKLRVMQRYSRHESFPTCSQQNQGKVRRGEIDSQKSSRGDETEVAAR